jgi:hypothetical protein
MITPLDEAENALKQMHIYLGISISIPEKIVAERLYNKALQKIEQARIQQQQQVMRELQAIREEMSAIKDVTSTTLFEVQASKGALVRSR